MAESPVAIVTGGARGIGAAICVTLLKKGYRVCVSDIREEKGKQFVKERQEEYGADSVKFITCDVSKEEDYKEMFDFTLREFQRIDLVVNNAGVLLEHNPRKMIDINLMGPIIACQLALKYMGKTNGGKGGMVIITASIQGFLPHHAIPVYVASKHGVIGLIRSYGLPYHLDRDGVVFTALCPALTGTDILDDCSRNSLQPDFNPLKGSEHECMTPEYVAEGVLKLLEDRVNGSTLVVKKSIGYTYIGYQEEFKGISLS